MTKEELGVDLLPYPKQVIFILGNEFCERFSFYGMRAVLSKYLKDDLKFSEDTATAIFHCFGFLAYFTPIFGAILADNYIGKFKTIFYVSIVYILGHLVKTMGATPPFVSGQVAMCFIGLIMIGIGTGGIKPCVASFGGDQFKLPEQQFSLEKFFYIFYLSINIGSLIGVYLTPIFREDIHCFGKDSCYPLAFGFPALLMIIALILFLVGKPFYKTIKPEGNILLKVLGVYGRGIKNKFSSTSNNKASHWLDSAKDKYDPQLVEDSKVLLKIFVLYLPLPIFWTLFDQQGSRWVFQGSKMNGWSNSLGHVKPDQMSIINPFLIILLIPIFNIAVYPILNKVGILTKPLHRMFLGGVLAGLAFVASAIVEQKMKNQNSPFYDDSQGSYHIMNVSPCKTSIFSSQMGIGIKENGSYNVRNVEPGTLRIVVNETESPCSGSIDSSFKISPGELTTAFLHGSPKLHLTEIKEDIQLRMGYAKTKFVSNQNSKLTLEYKEKKTSITFTTKLNHGLHASEISQLSRGNYSILDEDGKKLGDFEIKYMNSIMHVFYDGTSKKVSAFETSGFVNVHIFWQIPQYILITVGEILFSVTGLEFSYSQAPVSMKAVVQAAWLLTTALGNLFVMIISGFHPFQQVGEFIFFAVLMILCMIIFLGLGYKLGFMKEQSPREEPTSDKKEIETSAL